MPPRKAPSSRKPESKKLLDIYEGLLKTGPRFLCPQCGESVTSNQFEKIHARRCFQLNPRIQCVWCLGAFTWKSKTKNQQLDVHLRSCWETCAFRRPPPSSSSPPPPPPPAAAPSFHTRFPLPCQQDDPYGPDAGGDVDDPDRGVFVDSLIQVDDDRYRRRDHLLDAFRDDEELLCEERNLFGHAKFPHLPDVAYELFRVMDLSPYRVTLYRNEHLNWAASCVRAFVALKDTTHDFYHCTVRAVVMPQFLEAMQAEGCRTRMLPFSCWCNGGSQHEQAVHRQHRHFILVCEKERPLQEDLWGQIRIDPDDLPIVDPETEARARYFKSLHKLLLTDPFHFIHTLAYLSKRQSRCNGILERGQRRREGEKRDDNHFWILTSLPRRFRLPLMLQWDGGLMQLMTWLHQSARDEEVAQRPRQRLNGRWAIPIKHLPNARMGRVLLVAKHLRPTTPLQADATDHYVWLVGGTKMYFEEDASLVNLAPLDWCFAQAERGNVFYDVVGDALWTPRPYLQRLLNCVEVNRLAYERRKAKLERDHALLELEWRGKVDGMRVQLAAMKESHDAEVAALKSHLDAMKESHDAEVAALRLAALEKKDETMASRTLASLEKSLSEVRESGDVLRETLVAERAEKAALREMLEKRDAEMTALREAAVRKAGPSIVINY